MQNLERLTMDEYIEQEAAIDAIMKVYVRTAEYKARERVLRQKKQYTDCPPPMLPRWCMGGGYSQRDICGTRTKTETLTNGELTTVFTTGRNVKFAIRHFANIVHLTGQPRSAKLGTTIALSVRKHPEMRMRTTAPTAERKWMNVAEIGAENLNMEWRPYGGAILCISGERLAWLLPNRKGGARGRRNERRLQEQGAW